MDYIQDYGIEYLYHMTHVDNLPSIIQNGLLSHYEAHNRRLINTDISDQNVQDIRADIIDPFYGRPLHKYVPLYFSPRNPMLYRRLEIQEDILILGIRSQVLSNQNVLFTDGNAASSRTLFYKDLQMLSQLPWTSIRARSWVDIEDGRRLICAEVLVYPRIDPDQIQVVFCYSHRHREAIITAKRETSIIGKVNRDLYF